jgi:hypothetical protein
MTTPKRLSLLLLLPLVISSCTLNIKGVCISGPEKGKPVTAKASWNGFGSGTISMTTPWGEVAEGRYQTSLRGQSTKSWDLQEIKEGNVTTAEGDDVVITADGTGRTQVGTATLLGNQGTVIESVYWTTGSSPLHGQGKAKDTRGNRYRLLW